MKAQIPTHIINETNLYIKWRSIDIKKDDIDVAHRHSYYQFMFLEDVKGVHEIDFEEYEANSQSLHFVGKGRVHKVDFNHDMIGSVILFPESIFGSSDYELKLLASFTYFTSNSFPVLQLSKEEFIEIKGLVFQIQTSLSADNFDVGKYLLFALLARVREIHNSKIGFDAIKNLPNEIVKFNSLLRTNAKSWNSVDKYLDELALTGTRLNQMCKKYYGKTALQMLHERKLLEAKRMLVYTDKQVKEVAYDCGFEDVAYFNRFFKKNLNCTPIAFRKNH